MNTNYDLKAAGRLFLTSLVKEELKHVWTAKQLEYLAAERQGNSISGIQLSRCTKASDWPEAYQVVQNKPVWQLVFANADRKEQEMTAYHKDEVVAHIQGIIWRHDLPPFRNHAITANRTKYLRQSVSLAGLGTPTFEAAIEGILDVYSLFSCHVPHDKLKACACCDAYGEFSSVESSNRYFTSIKDCGPSETHLAFSNEIDPHGILASLPNTNYIHCDNNIVQYYERTILETGETKYAEISPVRFQVGDIVEAQMTFMLVTLPGDEYKMVSILRSLTMLDASYSQKAFLAQAASKLLPSRAPGAHTTTVKRKIGYADEERASTRMKLSRLEIDDDDMEDQVNESEGIASREDSNAE